MNINDACSESGKHLLTQGSLERIRRRFLWEDAVKSEMYDRGGDYEDEEIPRIVKIGRICDTEYELRKHGWVAPLGVQYDSNIDIICKWCRSMQIDFRILGWLTERHYNTDVIYFVGRIYVRRRYATLLKLKWSGQ